MNAGRIVLLLVVSLIPLIPMGPNILRLITSEAKSLDISAVSIQAFTEHRSSKRVLHADILTADSIRGNSAECRLFLFSGNKINESSAQGIPWLSDKKLPFSIEGRESRLPDTQCWIKTDVSYLYWWLCASLGIFVLGFRFGAPRRST